MNSAKLIDHTLLKPESTRTQIDQIIDEAKAYHFKSVCVNPTHVKYAAERLADSEVLVCTVIGFPLGASTTATKAFETEDAIQNGADEIDMVINIGALKDGRFDDVQQDIEAVVKAAKGHTVKVIIETVLLDHDEIVKASELTKAAGADFVKTSTGFAGGGATAEDVKLMKDTVGADVEVKASGGVRNLEDFNKMVEAGATRIGASAGVQIMQGLEADSELTKAAGADFVKTSTGFAGGGATAEDVKLMKDTVGADVEVKASGGVRNLEDFNKMVEAGATRIGASAGVQIMQGLEADSDY
ncbi:deoxyribose-phosphate aldolase [Staphylococcus aureus]|nr:deoxyribose-phosphate aldolase [Staphylococcus aureus]